MLSRSKPRPHCFHRALSNFGVTMKERNESGRGMNEAFMALLHDRNAALHFIFLDLMKSLQSPLPLEEGDALVRAGDVHKRQSHSR